MWVRQRAKISVKGIRSIVGIGARGGGGSGGWQMPEAREMKIVIVIVKGKLL